MGHDVRQNIIDMVHKLIDSTAERNFTGEGSFDWSVDLSLIHILMRLSYHRHK